MNQQSPLPILIIGGGLAGLSTACLLALHGTPSILLEKHQASSPHPRAVGFTARTMEIFSQIGIAHQIPQAPADFRLRRIQVHSLAGEWGEELGPGLGGGKGNGPQAAAGGGKVKPSSPFAGAAIPQDKLEPLLQARASELGVDVRFGHEMLRFELPAELNDPTSTITIPVHVRPSSGAPYTLQTPYLLAADGHRSSIRQTLQIPTSGRGNLETLRSVLFHAPSLERYLEKGFRQFQIRQQDGFAGFLTTYGDARWVFMFSDERQRTEPELRDAIVQATGIPDLQFTLLATGSWDLAARIAEDFAFPAAGAHAHPRVFLLGDAAHTLPPTRGGYGANTGIGDAHNLAWKLAAVVGGTSTPELLRSYDVERRPVAWVRHDQIFAGPDYAKYRVEGEGKEMRDPLAVELGQVYESGVILGGERKNDTGPLVLRPEELKGRPGSRAPYVVLFEADGSKISSLGLWGKHWTLVSSDKRWEDVGEATEKELGILLNVVVVPGDELKEEEEGEFVDAFGLQGGGACLVRPDGHVAWSSREWEGRNAALKELVGAMRQAACLAQPWHR